MDRLHHIRKKVLFLGLLIVTSLLLVACPEVEATPKIPTAVVPADFKVTTTFSADEPKLIVSVADLATEGLEKLEYKLERFSNQCNDSDKVYIGTVPNPTTSTSFDITTEAYGAYKLSVSATYGDTWYQNPVKTILPAGPSEDDFPDLATDKDFTGLVFVEVFERPADVPTVRQIATQDHIRKIPNQIHLPDGDGGFEFGVVNFRPQLELKFADAVDGKHQVITEINTIGTKDRKWCSSDGEDIVSKNLKPLLQDGTGALTFKNPIGEHEVVHSDEFFDPVLELVLEPNPINGDRVPFLFFNLVVYKLEKDANGNSVKGAEVLNSDYFIQDCATKKSEFSEFDFDRGDGDNRCFDDNDFPT